MAASRSGNGDVTGFQGLAQGLQRRPGEFGQFIQKEDAPVRQGDLARPRGRASC